MCVFVAIFAEKAGLFRMKFVITHANVHHKENPGISIESLDIILYSSVGAGTYAFTSTYIMNSD